MTKNIFFIRTFSQKRHDRDLGEEIRLEDSLLCDSERERKRPETNIWSKKISDFWSCNV